MKPTGNIKSDSHFKHCPGSHIDIGDILMLMLIVAWVFGLFFSCKPDTVKVIQPIHDTVYLSHGHKYFDTVVVHQAVIIDTFYRKR